MAYVLFVFVVVFAVAVVVMYMLMYIHIYPIYSRAGTRLFKNRRLIEYLKEATRSARLGTRSVLGAAGKVEI